MTGMAGMGTLPGAGNETIVQAFHTTIEHQAEIVLLVGFVLFVAWNVLRAQQYRRALAAGTPFPPPRAAVPPEPPARRIVRIAFGVLWIFDGLLQLQSAMSAGMATGVMAPAAATSPAWVRHLVGFGVEVWTRHPVSAAASAVWIQLGIGIFLLAAPAGRWSRVSGAVSIGWGIVVWIFGEAFGGIFAPGLTVAFGAPGAVVIYAVGGALVALPPRAWLGPRLGRVLITAGGVFLVGMAVLQAWPGRGSWQGGTTKSPGPLSAMAQQMATTSQPHLLSSAVASFASFDQQHGWGVNLFVVLALGLTGAMLLARNRRVISVAVVALVVLGIADWVLVEDFGFFGGLGTDPNSMLPLLILLGTGYVGMTRPLATLPAHAIEPSPPLGVRAVRVWWQRADSQYAARLAVAFGALVVVGVGAAPMVAASVNPRADPLVAQAIDGVPIVTEGHAPGFRLTDQHGTPVTLASLRGDTVALTFLDPVCTTDCPVIAQEFREASVLLGPSASRVRFVAIAANPQYHSTAVIDAFDRQEGLTSQRNWLFLTGSTSTLKAVLGSYGVSSVLTPAGGMAAHSDVAYIIDGAGNARRILNTDPGPATTLTRSSFADLLASEITQVERE
jgi:cytochrome oxidase Cu insertion factor (SCO1/SenC/PrrC family)